MAGQERTRPAAPARSRSEPRRAGTRLAPLRLAVWQREAGRVWRLRAVPAGAPRLPRPARPSPARPARGPGCASD